MEGIKPIPLSSFKIDDAFWNKYTAIARNISVPYQYDVIHDLADTGVSSNAVQNFKIAAGLASGTFSGMVFQDSDVAKWLESAAYSLVSKPDTELEQKADTLIELVVSAQWEDGYLNTFFSIKAPEERFTNLREAHELYCAGHFIEAACAYYDATGKRRLLDAVCKYADLIDSAFGPGEGKNKGYPGHQEIELALVKLYEVTGERRYLGLSKHFLLQRGRRPLYFEAEGEARAGRKRSFEHFDITSDEYNQTHAPVTEQTSARGHAVRAMYMYSAMADIALLYDDAELKTACGRLWDNVADAQLYITGGIGSDSHGEAFSTEYDLPNGLAYTETCASVGLMMFASRMLRIQPEGRYADIMEQALYNTVFSGISQDGKKYFYVNPLEVYPDAFEKHHAYQHVKTERQAWFECSCCPTNITRTVLSIGGYTCSQASNAAYIHLYIGGEIDFNRLKLIAKSTYLQDGKTEYTVKTSEPVEYEICFRIPDWAREYRIEINGEPFTAELKKGYAAIHRVFGAGDKITVSIDVSPRIVRANPLVREDAGKIAVMRGPLVYCAEEKDNGKNLFGLRMKAGAEFTERESPEFSGVITLETDAEKMILWDKGELYSSEQPIVYEPRRLELLPYFCWGNRGAGEMCIWIREKD